MDQRRIGLLALSLAVLALVLASVAGIVVIARGGAASVAVPAVAVAPPPPPASPRLEDRDVAASDVAALERDGATEISHDGMRVRDAELAKRLGLVPGDVVTSISGHVLQRDWDVTLALIDSAPRVDTLYVEVTRARGDTLLRWKVDGDLHALLVGGPSRGALAPAPPVLPALPQRPPDPWSDALIATIEKVDDQHFQIPRATVDAVLGNPMGVASGARVVPAMRNGRPDGFKLYAIRPSSLCAHLGLNNGDTLQTVNGRSLGDAAQALDAYTKLRGAKDVQLGIIRRGVPMTITITVK